jgi:hypothetical protein
VPQGGRPRRRDGRGAEAVTASGRSGLRSNRALLALPPLIASAVLAACTGEGPSGERASSAAGREGVGAAGGQAMLDAQAGFARCMREQGIDFPDPRPGRGFEFDPGPDPAVEERVRAAEERCAEERRAIAEAAPKLSPERMQQEQEAMLRFARCMRGEGQDVPDPAASGGDGGVAVEVPAGAKTDPAFQRASRQCERLARTPGADVP